MQRACFQFCFLLLTLGILACLAAGLFYGQTVLIAGAVVSGLCLFVALQPLGSRQAATTASCSKRPVSQRASLELRPPTDSDDPDALVAHMIRQGRAALLLRPQIAETISPEHLALAEAALDREMAVVPAGEVVMHSQHSEDFSERDKARSERRLYVDGYYLDRYPVTNQQYQAFVDAQGYGQFSLWDEPILSAVLGFVDQTGQSAPLYWRDGQFPEGKADHPVVGICWYEAMAFARWCGKRLPTDQEWVKATSWPVASENGHPLQRRFPWGDSLEASRANLWSGTRSDTCPVTAYPTGANSAGIQQLIGNVWEWTSSPFGAWEPSQLRLETTLPMKSLRGGAYDTYFDSQAHAQFQSGDSLLARKANIGFRCSIGYADVAVKSDLLLIESQEEALV